MAIKLKEGKTYNPERVSALAGVDMSHGNYYANIKEYQVSSEQKQLSFQLKIYGSEEIRNTENAQPVDTIGVNVNPDQFDEVVGVNGVTIAECYTIALELPQMADWESDVT